MSVLTGTSISTFGATKLLKNPTLGMDIELSEIPNKSPSDIDSLVIDLEKLSITTKYIDERYPIQITLKADLGEYGRNSTSDSVPVNNGETAEVSDAINPVLIEDLNIHNQNYLRGYIDLTFEHPDLTDSVRREFVISDSYGFNYGVESGSVDEWKGDTSIITYEATSNIVNSGNYAIRTESGGTYGKSIYKDDFSVDSQGISEVGWRFYIDQKDFDDISGRFSDSNGGTFRVNYDRETTNNVHIMGENTGYQASTGEWYKIKFYNIDPSASTADYQLINSNGTVVVDGSSTTQKIEKLDEIQITHANYSSTTSNTQLVHDDFYIR